MRASRFQTARPASEGTTQPVDSAPRRNCLCWFACPAETMDDCYLEFDFDWRSKQVRGLVIAPVFTVQAVGHTLQQLGRQAC